MALLAMCVGSYFTSLTGDLGAHFRQDTWVLLAALAFVWLVQLVRSLRPEALVAPAAPVAVPSPSMEPPPAVG
jgi:signal peptidase I